MYNVFDAFLDLRLLSGMAISRSFDSGISVVEQRSLVNYLKAELKRDVNKYVQNYMYLHGASDTLTEKVQIYVAGKKITDAGKSLSVNGKLTAKIYVNTQKYLLSFKETQEHRLTLLKFNTLVQNLINDNPVFIELNQSDVQISGHNPIKELIANNSKKNKTFNYIVSGTIGNATHFFLLEQQGNEVIVKDSVGSEERNDFFDAFLKFDIDIGIKFHRVSDKLQYSSGVCETYPVIQMLFDIRLRLFNRPYRDSILSSIFEKDGRTKLLGVFTDGLTEAPFGTFEGFVEENRPTGSQSSRMLSLGHGGAIYDARYALLETQKNRVEKTSKELYSVETEFKKIFAIQPTKQNQNPDAYLNVSLRLLDFLMENKFLVKPEKIKLISNLMQTSLKDISQDRLELAISIMLAESDKLLIKNSENSVSKIEDEYIKQQPYQTIQIGDLKNVLELYKNNNFADRLAKSILDSGMVDFSNPRTFIRAGYAYWKTLEYAEMFDRRVTRYILENKNFPDETKKEMLSVIYPTLESFYTIDKTNVYIHINNCYNGDNYLRIDQLLGNRFSYTKDVADVHTIFTEITSTQDLLESLPHFIAWNRKFREDIFKYFDEGTDDAFNQKIAQFFFETHEVSSDYVRVVAEKYKLYNILDSKATESVDIIVNMSDNIERILLTAQGNDREEFFDNMRPRVRDLNNRKDVLVKLGKKLDQQSLTFRSFFPEYVQDGKTVKVDVLGSVNVILDDQKNLIEIAASITNVFNVMLSRIDDCDLIKRDTDDFVDEVKDKISQLKTKLGLPSLKDGLNQQQQQPAQQNPGTGQPQTQEEIKKQIWTNLQDRISAIKQKFQDLSNINELFDNI